METPIFWKQEMVERQSAPCRKPVILVVPLARGTEHDTAVRDGFVTRNGDFSAQTIDFVKFHKNILHFPDRSREYRNVGPP